MKRLALVIAFAAVSCGAPVDPTPLPFAPASATASPDPTATGPFQVGVRTVTYQDTGRRKPDGTPRLLVTEIWYPAVQDVKGQPGVEYDIRDLMTDAQRASLANVVPPILKTMAVRDAKPDGAHGPYPVVVFSHGQGAVRWQSTYFTVLLASHGYVVLSPDHEGGTLAEGVRDTLQPVTVGIETRPVDVMHLINRMSRLKTDDPLYGLVDLEQVGVSGHSFGALTSLRVALMDPRVKAIVPQAPVAADIAWLGLPQPKLTIPVMIQAARLDKTLKWDEHIEPTWPLMPQPRYLLDISKGGHFTFSDLCRFDLASLAAGIKLDIPGANLDNVLGDGCAGEAPAAEVAHPIINHFAIAFFNAYLRGSGGSKALLTQERAEALTPGVAVVTAEP